MTVSQEELAKKIAALLRACEQSTGLPKVLAREIRAMVDGKPFCRYTHPTSPSDHVMTVAEFREQAGHELTDYDGFGFPVKDGKADEVTCLNPEDLSNLPEDATHVVWYNKYLSGAGCPSATGRATRAR